MQAVGVKVDFNLWTRLRAALLCAHCVCTQWVQSCSAPSRFLNSIKVFDVQVVRLMKITIIDCTVYMLATPAAYIEF